jgi:hypothetical protein
MPISPHTRNPPLTLPLSPGSVGEDGVRGNRDLYPGLFNNPNPIFKKREDVK